MEKVLRPPPAVKRISCKEEFELCYLRHQYLRKAEYNPTEFEMAPYFKIAEQQARNTYYTYQSLLSIVGMECDDLINICKIHIVSFLGLFSVEKMISNKYEDFVYKHTAKTGKVPSQESIVNKNKANFTIFLKQRMVDLVRVSSQKVRNIKGFTGGESFAYVGASNPPRNLSMLINQHEKFGYIKLDIAVFKTIRKRAGKPDSNAFEFNGKFYVSLKIENKKLEISDFAGADMDPHDTLHYMSPDRIYAEREEANHWMTKREEFNNYVPNKKAQMLKKFVNKHKHLPKFRQEVKLAKQMIKNLGI